MEVVAALTKRIRSDWKWGEGKICVVMHSPNYEQKRWAPLFKTSFCLLIYHCSQISKSGHIINTYFKWTHFLWGRKMQENSDQEKKDFSLYFRSRMWHSYFHATFVELCIISTVWSVVDKTKHCIQEANPYIYTVWVYVSVRCWKFIAGREGRWSVQ